MNRLLAGKCVAVAALTLGLGFASTAAFSADQKFPGKGAVTIGSGPVPLLIHYLASGGKDVEVKLRDINYEQPQLARSKELQLLAKTPCGKGDVVNLPGSKFGADAKGVDAAGIGRFVWVVNGQFSSDGDKWWFKGTIRPNRDRYDFNKGKDGERAFWAEVSTRLGATFPGKEFWVYIDGSLPVSIDGICSLNSAGQAIA